MLAPTAPTHASRDRPTYAFLDIRHTYADADARQPRQPSRPPRLRRCAACTPACSRHAAGGLGRCCRIEGYQAPVLASTACTGIKRLYWHQSACARIKRLYWHQAPVLASSACTDIKAPVLASSACTGIKRLHWHQPPVLASKRLCSHQRQARAGLLPRILPCPSGPAVRRPGRRCRARPVPRRRCGRRQEGYAMRGMLGGVSGTRRGRGSAAVRT